MAYQKQTWENLPSTNTPISADRLNHIEDGIDNAYKQIKNIYNASTTDSYSCNYVNGLNGKILWTNTGPQYGFSAQTINLSETLNNYDMYEIIFQQSTTTERLFTTGKIPVGYGTILCWHTTSNYYRPTATTVSGASITFEDGKSSSSQDNGSTIPMYVIGYKTNLFS